MAGSVSSNDGDMGFQIAPMVDVVFVLLLFFMAIAGEQNQEKRLTIDLPSRPPVGAPVLEVPLIISISPEGKVTMNDVDLGQPSDKELSALRQKLGSLAQPGEDGKPKLKDLVVIRPANDARHERVIDVLNACAAAQVANLTFG